MVKSLSFWKEQLADDKRKYKLSKKQAKHGKQKTGYRTTKKGKKKSVYAVGRAGELCRQSLAGYKRALKRKKR